MKCRERQEPEVICKRLQDWNWKGIKNVVLVLRRHSQQRPFPSHYYKIANNNVSQYFTVMHIVLLYICITKLCHSVWYLDFFSFNLIQLRLIMITPAWFTYQATDCKQNGLWLSSIVFDFVRFWAPGISACVLIHVGCYCTVSCNWK